MFTTVPVPILMGKLYLSTIERIVIQLYFQNDSPYEPGRQLGGQVAENK